MLNIAQAVLSRTPVPPRISAYRSISFGSLFAFCLGGAFFIMVYYLPIWFQAVHGVSPVKSGIDNIPLILAQVIATLVAGFLTTVIGYYMPFIVASSILMAVGGGLLTTFTANISSGKWIGYQIIFGAGVGFGFQHSITAAQAVLPLNDIPAGVTAVLFIQLLGGALMVSAGQNVFTNNLKSGLSQIPGVDAGLVVSTGATGLRTLVTDPQKLASALEAYNNALVRAFRVSLIMACLSALGAMGMEWKSVKKSKPSDDAGDGH